MQTEVDGEAEAETGSCSWFDPVPSPSNPADAPSRGEPPLDSWIEAMDIPAVEKDLPMGLECMTFTRFVNEVDPSKNM